MRFLIDEDGTIANWGKGWDTHAVHKLHLGLVLTQDQKSFNLYDQVTTDEGRAAVTEIMNYPRFYRDLEPIEGAAEALNAMVDEGHDVRIVTSPWITNETCASDKLWWLEQYIGPGWAKRAVITADKTVVRGDILIDDKPEIDGVLIPEWEHVWFTQPYNAALNHFRRLDNWADWRNLLHD